MCFWGVGWGVLPCTDNWHRRVTSRVAPCEQQGTTNNEQKRSSGLWRWQILNKIFSTFWPKRCYWTVINKQSTTRLATSKSFDFFLFCCDFIEPWFRNNECRNTEASFRQKDMSTHFCEPSTTLLQRKGNRDELSQFHIDPAIYFVSNFFALCVAKHI